ncbi:hypothetical protein DSM3645_28357 [Blastopirellula marina DSM 3645]|uniref:Uncharacterized protein n=2 Tax=Blastopirellula marina TaxID=124 RepID=A3ZP93_9BACT|nr:hypothetical protein DSM3645_28357 [Blastopirellula marina DSM 3645]
MDVSFAQDVMQPPRLQPNRLPTTSPYLLLGNRSFDPALSYYRIIRPENQIRSAYTSQAQRITQLRSEVNRQQQEIDQAENSLLNPTGHRAMFQNYGGYFGGYSRGTGYFGVQ